MPDALLCRSSNWPWRDEKAIIDGAVKLEKTGVDFIALPCNTAHVYYEEIQQALSVPMLHIVEETIKRFRIPQKSGGFRNRANHPIRHLPKSSEGKWTRSYSQGPLAAGCEPAYRRNQTAKSYAAYTSIVADAIWRNQSACRHHHFSLHGFKCGVRSYSKWDSDYRFLCLSCQKHCQHISCLSKLASDKDCLQTVLVFYVPIVWQLTAMVLKWTCK